MSKGNDFTFFVDLFFSCPNELRDGFLSIDTTGIKISIDEFIALLKANGVLSNIDHDGVFLTFGVGSGSFSSESPIFTTFESLWRKALALKELPENFLVIKESTSSLNSSDLILKMKLHLQWKKVVCPLTVYDIAGKTVWYLPDEDGGKEVVIDINDNIRVVRELAYSDISFNSATKLKAIIDLEDAQTNERKSILKKAISDFVADDHSFHNIIDAGERVLNRYNDLLDLYTKRFSVDKILNEIESKSLEYTTKINDYISSSQSKAFTIPGALIAVGALFKAGGFLEGMVILVGLYMVYCLTKSANDAQRESYEDLKKGLNESFQRYHQFDEGAEVRKAANNTLVLLIDKIDRANKRLDDIDSLGIIMQVVAFLYILVQFIRG